MKIGIMQPYFFPYIGYWQLIKEVDTYVIFDDVKYINRGWINRNRILDGNGGERYINVYLKAASQNRLIREVEVDPDHLRRESTLSVIRQIYRKAPFFDDVFPIVERIIMNNSENVANYNGNLITEVCNLLDISTNIVYSSSIKKDNSLKGEKKIIEICNILHASEYINAIGGIGLYHASEFSKNGISLYFIKTGEIKYRQFESNDFHANMSIIDVLMFNSLHTISRYLRDYTLIRP